MTKTKAKEGSGYMEKRKSAIEKVIIEGRSYDHEEFEPTFINFSLEETVQVNQQFRK